MTGRYKLHQGVLLSVACFLGFYCAFVTYRAYHPTEYDMAEWKRHLKQNVYDKTNMFETLSREISVNKSVANCTLKKIGLSTQRLPVTGLASFPGSGNTWTRHLIQQMTGLGTSSEYCDTGLAEQGFPFECYEDRSRVIVVKTHEAKFYGPYQKLVLLIRNPFDAFLSMMHQDTVGHIGRTDIDKLKEQNRNTFDDLVLRYISLLGNTIKTFRGPVYILEYDKLKTNMAEELQKLATFLGVVVSQSDIDCTVMLQEGHYHRKRSATEHLNTLKAIFSQEQLLTMREVARFSEKMIQGAYMQYPILGGQTEKLLFNSDSNVPLD